MTKRSRSEITLGPLGIQHLWLVNRTSACRVTGDVSNTLEILYLIEIEIHPLNSDSPSVTQKSTIRKKKSRSYSIYNSTEFFHLWENKMYSSNWDEVSDLKTVNSTKYCSVYFENKNIIFFYKKKKN